MVLITIFIYCCLITTIIVTSVDVLILLCKNNRFRYYGCYFCYVLNTSALAPLYILLVPFMLVGNHLNIYFTALPAQILSTILSIEWEVRGLEYLDRNRPGVITATHQTMFDILGLFILGTSLRNTMAIARKALLYIVPVGPMLWFSGAVIFINNRKKGSNSTRKKMSDISKLAEKKKMKIIVFPEGTRNLNGDTLLPFKNGAFKLAIESKFPIIPIVFSPYYFIDHQKKTFKTGRVIISVLPPIETETNSMSDLETIKNETQVIMETEFQKLKSEIIKSEIWNGIIVSSKATETSSPKLEAPSDKDERNGTLSHV